MTKILMIEDENTLREEVCEWLMLEGYEVLDAQDGVAGIELAYKHRPDLIICDIAMPRMNGHNVLLELQSHPETVTIPFIFVTARSDTEDIRHGMSLGADDYITKPFTRLQLLESITSRLEKKAQIEENFNQKVDYLASALDEERTKQLLKSRMVSMFAHDFRNPLTVIMSSANILQNYSDKMTKERRSAKLQQVVGAVSRLIQMLDEMLLIAEMEGGHLQFNSEQLDLTVLVKDIVDNFQFIYWKTHTIDLTSNLNGKYLLDARLVGQIIDNLLSNATKYSPQGGKVIVSLTEAPDAIQIVVKDEGLGIPESSQVMLFEAFQRGANVGQIKGTGLGLAIVKQAVDMHGGHISFISEVNIGTTFTITLPNSKLG